jgi:hypothetical protein
MASVNSGSRDKETVMQSKRRVWGKYTAKLKQELCWTRKSQEISSDFSLFLP